MAEKHLGPVFEIHGGGLDLVFPHHENEIAQSRGAGREFARIWMHNGMLRFGGEKMSKSVGNVVTLRDAVEEWGRRDAADALPGRALAQADGLLGRDARRGEGSGGRLPRGVSQPVLEPGGSWDDLVAALEDDFNTPEALAVMHEWRDHELLRRGARALRARLARGAGGGAGRAGRAGAATRRGPRRRRLRRGRPAAAGDRGTPAGKSGTWRETPATGSFRSDDRATRSTGGARCARRSAARARCSSSGRPSARSPPSRGCRRTAVPRVQVKPERELTEAAGTRDHQGVVASVEPYRYADAYELAQSRARCSSASTA